MFEFKLKLYRYRSGKRAGKVMNNEKDNYLIIIYLVTSVFVQQILNTIDHLKPCDKSVMIFFVSFFKKKTSKGLSLHIF